MRRLHLVSCSALVLWGCLAACAQDVISAHSGVIHYSEGVVWLDGQKIEQRPGVFPSMKDGSVLRTEQGRVEVLLTPGVVLRMDENAELHMVSNSLTNTRLQLVTGSIIIDTLDAPSKSPVVVAFKDSEVRFPKPGIYRIDGEVAVLQAYRGEAEVTKDGVQHTIDTSHLFFFPIGMATEKISEGDMDEFYDWARNRSQVLSDENQLAQEGADDSADAGVDPNAAIAGFPAVIIPSCPVPYSNFPAVGVPSGPYYYPYSGIGAYPYFGIGAPYFPFAAYTTFFVFVPYRPHWRDPVWLRHHTPSTVVSRVPSGSSRWPITIGLPHLQGMSTPGIGTTAFHSPNRIYRPNSIYMGISGTGLSRPRIGLISPPSHIITHPSVPPHVFMPHAPIVMPAHPVVTGGIHAAGRR